jgi:antibiotic biosynthesis monooxygenase (ABM) superfamily enzyme
VVKAQNDQAGSKAGLPVTVVVARRPVPGREAELDAWVHGIVEAANAFPGNPGPRSTVRLLLTVTSS